MWKIDQKRKIFSSKFEPTFVATEYKVCSQEFLTVDIHWKSQICTNYILCLELGDDNCVRLWLHTHLRMQKEHKENSFDGCENTSTSGEFGEIRRCFQWRHSREEPYTSRWRIIAQAQIFSAFTSPEVEVNIIQRWLIVTSLQRGGFTDPGHINVVLREIPCEDKFSFLNVKSRHIFHVWKARRTMVNEGRDREWLLKQQLLLRAASERCDNVGRTLRRAV